MSRTALLPSFLLACLLTPTAARAQRWVRHVGGLRAGTYPVLAVAQPPRRDVYYSVQFPAPGGMGAVWRGRIDDPSAPFVQMPPFPLPAPAPGNSLANVFTLTTNRLGEPVVGLSANGRSDNTAPMLMTWSEADGRWLAPPVTPAGHNCTHNLYRVDRAPNGDLWGICQWEGAYVSTDDGRSFRYLDLSALVRASHPSYFPTRAAATEFLGALYSLTFAADGAVIIGSETGGVVTSSDRGATWHPLDPDAANPRSPLAGVTAVGNVYGLSARPDGRLIVHGFQATTSPLASDPTRLYLVDRVARTVTPARGVPDYTLGGRLQIVSLPSGESFFHTNRNTVDDAGAPTYGGIQRTADGLTWAAANDGIREAVMVSGMSLWVDGNGRGAGGGFAVDGSDLYTVTAQGNVYRYVRDGATTPDASTPPDAAADAVVPRDVAVDVSEPRDVAVDVSAPPDASIDAPADAAPDVGAPPDVAPDAPADVALDAAPDADASGDVAARVDASPEDVPAPAEDVAVDAPDAPDAPSATPAGGCACDAGAPARSTALAWLAWATLLVRRRRRR